MTSTWQEPNKNTEIFLAVNKQDSEKGNDLKARKKLTTSLTRTQVGDSTDSRGDTCRQLRQDRESTCKNLRHRRQRGTKPSGRRAIGILSILQVLTSVDFFKVRTGFGCLEKNILPTDGGCEQYTHKYSTYRVALSITTVHHANTRGSRLRIIFVSLKYVSSTCHVSPALVCFLSHLSSDFTAFFSNLSTDFTDTHNTSKAR